MGNEQTTKQQAGAKKGGPSPEDILKEARGQELANYTTSVWDDDKDVDDTDQAPIFTADGKPRRYWQVKPGETLFGYYLGCEVMTMPKFGTKGDREEDQEERAFFLFEVANPPGYKEADHGGKKYAVRVRRPRSQVDEVAVEGDVVYVGVRSRLRALAILSGLPYQAKVGLRVGEPTRTARGFNLHNFDQKAWPSDRPAMRTMSGESAVTAFFAAQDRGLYALEALFGMIVPESLRAIADAQSAPKAIEAGNGAAQAAISAQASAST